MWIKPASDGIFAVSTKVGKMEDLVFVAVFVVILLTYPVTLFASLAAPFGVAREFAVFLLGIYCDLCFPCLTSCLVCVFLFEVCFGKVIQVLFAVSPLLSFWQYFGSCCAPLYCFGCSGHALGKVGPSPCPSLRPLPCSLEAAVHASCCQPAFARLHNVRGETGKAETLPK